MRDFAKKLRNLPAYEAQLRELKRLEEDRRYCRHDEEHFSAVADIMLALNRENGLSFSEDMIVACAYLHDMGRVEEYKNKISHDKASVTFVREILCSMGWSDRQIAMVANAVASHSKRYDAAKRFADRKKLKDLGELLSFADHFSRRCFACGASSTCKWREEEKITHDYWK